MNKTVLKYTEHCECMFLDGYLISQLKITVDGVSHFQTKQWTRQHILYCLSLTL